LLTLAGWWKVRRLLTVRVGIGFSVQVRDVPVDPAVMLAEVADWVDQRGVEVTRFDDGLVRFSAVDGAVLAELAGPIAAWWQSYEPSTRGEVALRLIGPGGVTEVTYCRPEDAVDTMRVLIGQECVRNTSRARNPEPYAGWRRLHCAALGPGSPPRRFASSPTPTASPSPSRDGNWTIGREVSSFRSLTRPVTSMIPTSRATAW
jgi:hypothetical protein